MTAPRIVVPGATTAITRRTVLRKAFLAPWHPQVEQCWLYSLADAQRQTGVAVHHSVLVVSHHHTTVTPTRDNLPEFLRRFHRDMSCALHTQLAAERYDAPRELFDDRQAHAMRLMDADAQASHLVYERLNPVAAGLVDRLEHMPMRALDFGLRKVGFLEVERPPVYFDSSRPERLRLELTPPPLLYEAFDGDLDKLVHHMERLTEHSGRALRSARGRAPLGAKGLRRLNPWSEPRTLRESGGEPVPTFRFGARGMVARRARIEGALEVRAFRLQHREAHCAFRDGDRAVRHPFCTYGARVHHGARVEPEPPPDAQVAMPGPSLDDIALALARREHEIASTAHDPARFALLDRVQDAFVDEAADILADAALDFAEGMPARGRGPERSRASHASDDEPEPTTRDTTDGLGERSEDEQPAEREPARVMHRFAPRTDESARRLIVLRDRRRGRPPNPGGNHGSDPPC